MSATSPITTHVLDVSQGRPATGISVRLELSAPTGGWELVGTGITNAEGRVTDLLKPSTLTPGSYRLTIATGDYFAAIGSRTFYPQVTIEFLVDSATEHYHVPLMLSPFGYSTYRGS